MRKLLFLFCFPLSTLLAAPPSAEIRHKTRDLEKVKAELGRKKEERERLKKETEELASELSKSESKMQSVEQSLDFTLSRTRDVQQKIASAKNEHDHLVKETSEKKSQLRETAVDYYLASALMGPRDVTTVYSRQLINGQAGLLMNTENKRHSAKTSLNSLTTTGQTLRQEMQRQQGILSDVKSNYASKEKLLEKKKTRAQMIQSELSELQKTSEELSGLIEVLRTKVRQEREQEKKERQDRHASGQSPLPPRSLPWPVRGPVVEKFGRQKQAEINTTYISNGIVVQPSLSAAVKSVGNGTVLYAGQFMRYGAMVLIEHPGDWYSVYGRLGKWTVEKGQAVTAGQDIGQAGVSAVGKAETYFELRFYGKPVDPMPWLMQ